MTEQRTVQRIHWKRLPGLLEQVVDEQATDFALVGPRVRLSNSPENWPEALKGRIVFQLTGELPGLPRELLRLNTLKSLTLWMLGLRADDAAAITEHLGQLTSLDLSINPVGEAGARVIAEHLGQLTSLDLGGNHVGDAGAQAIAEHLGQLTSLSLGGNQVGDAGARAIAERVGQLTSLDLCCNQVSDVGAHAIAEHLGQLALLDLSNTEVGDEAVAAIGERLTELVTLNLEHNERITTVGPLANLPLSTLNIANTGVANLSPLRSLILAGLPVKWSAEHGEGPGIYVEGCPLTHPSPEVVSQGPEAMLNFFREIESQRVEWLFEAKLLIVGEGGAGKTSLMRRTYQPELALPAEDETTRGIAIHRHEFPMPDGPTFRLNVWDFGGQQIYHATHQFFLTKNSL